jgi:hemerythrin superfamily protein
MAHTRIRAIIATAILRDDHRKVKELFTQYEKIGDVASGDSRLELFLEIRKELSVHSDIEEEIFYPAIESLRSKDEEAGNVVREAREQHQEVRTLLDELGELQPEDEEFDDRMKTLIESVTDHADKEEEQIFPYFDELSRDERVRVSDELRNRKAELTEEYGEE